MNRTIGARHWQDSRESAYWPRKKLQRGASPSLRGRRKKGRGRKREKSTKEGKGKGAPAIRADVLVIRPPFSQLKKLLHDWSNFDLPKIMPVEHIFLMPSSCLSLTLIHARIHANKLLITAQPIRNLRTPASAEWIKGSSYGRRPFSSLPYPPPFFTTPYPFRRLLRRLRFPFLVFSLARACLVSLHLTSSSRPYGYLALRGCEQYKLTPAGTPLYSLYGGFWPLSVLNSKGYLISCKSVNRILPARLIWVARWILFVLQVYQSAYQSIYKRECALACILSFVLYRVTKCFRPSTTHLCPNIGRELAPS